MNTETRKIYVQLDTGYCGMESREFWIVPKSWTNEEINQAIWLAAVDNAESYGIYPDDDDEDTVYSGENIDGWFEDYNPEEHDRYRSGSGIDWTDMT